MRCHECRAISQFCGTSQDGRIEWYVCPACSHCQFVAVAGTPVPLDPTIGPKPDAHLGACRE